MAKREREQMETFCRTFLRTLSPERAAAAAGVADPMTLLRSAACQKELKRQRALLDAQLTQQDVLRRMADLAFGRANDCVRLVLEPEVDVRGLELDLLAELKRSEKGALEVKLVDRTALLQALLQHLTEAETPMDDLLRAMGREPE